MSGKIQKQKRRTNHAVMMFMEELGARVVAQTGIPSDRYHLGKLILQGLRDDPDHVLQIDAGAGTSETSGSVLERTIKCAIALQKLGLKKGDVMVLMVPNSLDLCIPFYAALCLGVIIAGTDMTFGVKELVSAFQDSQPRIVFCQNTRAQDVDSALKQSRTEAQIVTFGKDDKFICFSDLLEDIDTSNVKDFQPVDLDSQDDVAFLTATSGTTGGPKPAELTHKNLTLGLPLFSSRYFDFPNTSRREFFVSPLQWISSGLHYVMSPILRYTRIQSSAPVSNDHIYDIINSYRPTATIISPTLLTLLLTPGERNRCDFTCLEVVIVGGSFVPQTLVETMKQVAPNANIDLAYGLSETSGLALSWDDDSPIGSVGRPMGYLQYRLVDPSTLEDIEKPHVTGELWMKGPTIFKGYYKKPEDTKATFSEDGWLKSGDLFYRDEQNNFFFVDRLKSLLKYRSHQISPTELEQLIRSHPGVADAVVVGIPHDSYGDLPAAAVVLQPGATVTADEIKDLVKESLADSKQLRGGVVFMKEFPLTATTKTDRLKLKKMVIEMGRQ